MNVNRLTLEAQQDLFDEILQGLKHYTDDPFILQRLVDLLDDLDGDDSFGTEGWKHAFGVED